MIDQIITWLISDSSSDLKHFANTRPSASKNSFSQSLEQFWKQNTICLQFSIGFLFFEIFVGFYIFHIVSRCTGNRRLQSLYHVIKCINPPFLVYIKTFEIPTSAMIWHFRGKWKMFYLVCCFIQLLQTRNYYVWDCRLLIGIS